MVTVPDRNSFNMDMDVDVDEDHRPFPYDVMRLALSVGICAADDV